MRSSNIISEQTSGGEFDTCCAHHLTRQIVYASSSRCWISDRLLKAGASLNSPSKKTGFGR